MEGSLEKIKAAVVGKADSGGRIKFATFASAFMFLLFALFSVCHSASAASLYLSPSSGDYLTGQAFSIIVYVSSADQAMNAASGALSFSNSNLEITSLTKSGSIFSLWVQEPSYSNTTGTVNFEGIVLNPGFTGVGGKVLTINFKAKSIGEASLNFRSGSVLANDGLGTNILTILGSAKFDINTTKEGPALALAPAPALAAAPKTEKVPIAPALPVGRPAISSSTHPDQNAWYNSNDPTFSWNVPSGIIADRLLYDKFPNSAPQVNYSPAVSSKLLPNMDDGVWYFHVQLKNSAGWGATSHYRFQIDTAPPSAVSIKLPDGEETANPRPKIAISATDALSGIDHYRIVIDKGDAISVSAADLKDGAFTLPTQSIGKHTIVVAAFDKAGNSATATESFIETGLTPPTITNCPQALPSGKILTAKGVSYPDSEITAYLQKGEEVPIAQKLKSGSDGKFLFNSARLPEGDYKLWAEVANSAGLKSGASQIRNITVTLAGAGIGAWQNAYFYIIIILLIIILLISATTAYLWYRLRLEVKNAARMKQKNFPGSQGRRRN